MRLAFIEVAGFRGFKDKARFDLQGGFAVLTGRNGAGKSTVLDAVDFALTGSINKYPVTSAKGGGLDDHIWWVGEGHPKEEYVTVGFVSDDGDELVVTRSRERGLERPLDELARQLHSAGSPPEAWLETLMQTSLIRDEKIAALSLDLPGQARFAAVRDAIGGLVGPDHSKRTDAILNAASAAKVAQEKRVADAQAELGRLLSALTEARSLAERQADVAEAEQIISSLAPDLGGAPRERDELLRRRIVEKKQSELHLADAVAKAEELEGQRRQLESATGLEAIAAARAEHAAAKLAKERADEVLADALQLEARERESDHLLSHMVALLDHGEAVGLQAGHCPLCDAPRSAEKFAAAVAVARSKLSARGTRMVGAAKIVEQARLVVDHAQAALMVAQRRLTDMEARRTSLLHDIENVAETFKRWAGADMPSDLSSARRLVHKRQEETARLEQALFVLEASGAHDRVAGLEVRVGLLRAQLEEEAAKLSAAERAADLARQISNAAAEVVNQVLTESFDTALPLLRDLYRRLRPHADWREIEIDFGGRVRASLNFTVGDGRNPQFVFSSGQRRVAGIAFLLAVHLSRPWCRLRSLLLDDPVQHIDDYRALNLIEVLSAVRRTGRQIIVAVEDPALADALCRRLRSTAVERGTRFDLGTSTNGSAKIERQVEIFPLPHEALGAASA
jgi:DNA repair exonuclease SbcCD ATPase subunit